MKRLATLALSALLILPLGACEAQPRNLDRLKEVVVLLEITTEAGSGTCSGTALSDRTILTATHCFQGPLKSLKVNGAPVKVAFGVDDEADHMLVVLDQPLFNRWARVSRREMVMGEDITIIGNPGRWRGILRRGYVAGQDVEMKLASDFLDLNGFNGDSGAGVFDDRGMVVATISYGKNQVNPQTGQQIKLAGTIRFRFTREQWRSAGVR